MGIDRGKKRVTFLTYDEIHKLRQLIKIHLDDKGCLRLSGEDQQALESAFKSLSKAAGEILASEGMDWLKEEHE